MKKKVFYIIFADILVASLLFVVCNINELGFVIITFYAMCVSGVFGFFLRRSEETEEIGDIMLYNTFIIPFIFTIFIAIGDFWRHYKIYGDDKEYRFDYNTYHFELVLHGDKYKRSIYSDDSIKGDNIFGIKQVKTDFGIGESGYYEKNGDNRYMLIKEPTHYRTPYPDGCLCKDTMLLSNDTLYFFFAEPVLVKKKSIFDL